MNYNTRPVPPQPTTPNAQRGAALILALLVVAIVSAIATSLLFSQEVDIQRSFLENSSDQARLNTSYIPLWWHSQWDTLSLQRKQQKQVPLWPQIMPPQNFPNGDVLTAKVIPANARFNVNTLAEPVSPYLTLFSQLIQAVAPNISAPDAMQIAVHTQQWLIANSTKQTNNTHYSRQRPPYQPAHMPMASASELRLVQGVTAQLYRRLRPYIIALPATKNPINVNAAPKVVLMALLGLNEGAAEQVLQFRRQNGGFLDAAQFTGLSLVQPYMNAPGPNKTSMQSLLTTKPASEFLVTSTVKNGKNTWQRYQVLTYNAKQHSMTTLQQGPSL